LRKGKSKDAPDRTLAPLIPRADQKADIESICESGGTALIVTQVGGGKTLVGVEVGLGIGAHTVLVIAPQGTHKRSWVRTIQRQSPDAVIKKLDSSAKGKKAMADLQWGEPGWYYCTPQWFSRQTWTDIQPDLAIFDEIHIAGAFQNVTRTKLHQLQAKARLGMSGTPLRNKIENAWAIVRWLWPELMPNTFWHWRMTLKTEYDRFAPQNRKVVGEHVPGTIVNSLPCYIQHLQREHCCEFHPNGFLAELEEPEEIIRTVTMTPKQKRFYAQMEANYVAWLTTPDEDGEVPVVAELPVVARGILRACALGLPSIRTVTVRVRNKDTGEMEEIEKEQIYFEDDCESPKIDEVLEVLWEMGDETAIIYTHSKKFVKVMMSRLEKKGISCRELSGDITQAQRDTSIEEFIHGEVRVVVAVISAVGTGTDGLQEATSTEIWVSLDDDPTNNQQARGRADRPGQKNRVTRIEIRAEDTYDEGIMSKDLEAALNMSKTLRKKKR
jgi:superfamily II DNA or RNA helicase